MRILIAVLLSAAAASAVHLTAPRAAAHDFSVGAIHIGHPIVAPPPNGRTTTAGYLTLENRGETADRLVSASSPRAQRIEIHETTETANGVLQMRRLESGVAVPAGETVRFAPYGLHLMVIGVTGSLGTGDTLPLTLTFERAGSVEVIANVERPGHGSAASRDPHGH